MADGDGGRSAILGGPSDAARAFQPQGTRGYSSQAVERRAACWRDGRIRRRRAGLAEDAYRRPGHRRTRLALDRAAGQCRSGPALATAELDRIFQTEGLRIVVISKSLGITRPGGDRSQCLFDVFTAHMIFQLVEEPAFGRDV